MNGTSPVPISHSCPKLFYVPTWEQGIVKKQSTPIGAQNNKDVFLVLNDINPLASFKASTANV